jgi:hypothetical protein
MLKGWIMNLWHEKEEMLERLKEDWEMGVRELQGL